MGKTKPQNWIVGRWHIVSMDQWDEDYLNEEVQAFMEFEPSHTGQFQFGYVQGGMDCRATILALPGDFLGSCP